ncbi:MAG TPA: enolase C-terminal domain-like protein [Candidatus Xenobia bacterium]|jgi:L-alanine-DL-glutamate epimerase-like enolase superfamily enzyme
MTIVSDKLPLQETRLDGPRRVDVPINRLDVDVYTVPTETPESDGTVTWDRTTMVLVTAWAGGESGIGWTYAAPAAAQIVHDTLRDQVVGQDALNVSACWLRMVHAVRNRGLEGVCSMAISAVDCALWDLKAGLLGIPLACLLGQVRDRVAVYGSGGFTSYSIHKLQKQLSGWVAQRMRRVKMKIGTHPDEDEQRVRAARQAVGNDVDLFVDANGAYHPRQALAVAERMVNLGVVWLEEPVDHQDVAATAFVRDHCPPGLDVSGGEYGYAHADYFVRLLSAVDVLQADATRCGGFTGFLRVAALADAYGTPLSSHCAPTLHVPMGVVAPAVCHLEYFFDHVRIEHMFFDGALPARDGYLAPDLTRPGLGLDFKSEDAEKYRRL